MGEYKEKNTVCSPGADFSRKESRFLSLKLFCIKMILSKTDFDRMVKDY
jgi:hypothetical protein